MVNDGKVVMKQDNSGIEKANYGNFFMNIFRKVRTAPNDPQENVRIRQALAEAIRTSTEGKAISDADMKNIRIALGVEKFVNTLAAWNGIVAAMRGEGSLPADKSPEGELDAGEGKAEAAAEGSGSVPRAISIRRTAHRGIHACVEGPHNVGTNIMVGT